MLNGQRVMIQAKSNEYFAEVALRYMNKVGLTEQLAPKFFYNSTELIPESPKTLEEYRVSSNSNIDVVLSS